MVEGDGPVKPTDTYMEKTTLKCKHCNFSVDLGDPKDWTTLRLSKLRQPMVDHVQENHVTKT